MVSCPVPGRPACVVRCLRRKQNADTFAHATCALSALCELRVVSSASAGGVKVTTEDGKITCDNTLESRLELTVHDLEPAVRYALFPSCRAEKRDKPPAVREGEEDLLA